MRHVPQKAVELIKHWESCRLAAYDDGGGVWTIGYGHTGSDVEEGLLITQEEAEDLFREDLRCVAQSVEMFVLVPISDSQFGALVSLAYNIGLYAFSSSTLIKYLNASNYGGASREFLKWEYDNGKVLKGLRLRREAEKSLFDSVSE